VVETLKGNPSLDVQLLNAATLGFSIQIFIPTFAL